MSIPIKVSELDILPQVTSDDYIVLNDSASLTTRRTTADTFLDFLTGSNKPFKSSSYALSSSYSVNALLSAFCDTATVASWTPSSSYASRSSYTTYVFPDQQLSAGTINMVGTASWATSCSNLPVGLYPITAAHSKTASFLYHDPNWNSTGVLNGSASYSLTSSYAVSALSILGGVGISGNGTVNLVPKWSSTGVNQPLIDSTIWDYNGSKIFRDDQTLTVSQCVADNQYLYNTFIGDYSSIRPNSFIFVGGDVILTGSAGSRVGTYDRGMSPRLTFLTQETTTYWRAGRIYYSSSYVDSAWNNGTLVFETLASLTHDGPFVFRTQVSDSTKYDHVIITPDGTDVDVEISGSLWSQTQIGVGNVMPRTGIGAKLHISGSLSDTLPLLVTEATNPSNQKQYLGLYVLTNGQVGIGTTEPSTRLEATGSFSTDQYYVKNSTGNYSRGLTGTYIAFNTSDPNGVGSRVYLQFKEGLLINTSDAPPLIIGTIPSTTPPTTPPTTTPPSGGGGGGCPAIWQEIETLELGIVPAEKVEKGMHLRDIDGWNLVYKAYTDESDIWSVIIAGEKFDVDSSHLWMIDKDIWKKVTDLRVGDVVYTSIGVYLTVQSLTNLGRGKFRHMEVDRKRYILGKNKTVGHNLDFLVKKY